MLEKKPLLSIIIPVYNVEKFVEECVESIFAQDLEIEDFEIILVNDGSTDFSLEICKKIEQNCNNVHLISLENRGVSIARNVGVENSKGDFLYFIDSDDFLDPGYLSEILQLLKLGDYDFVGFCSKRIAYRFHEQANLKKPLIKIIEGNGIKLINDFNFNNGPWWYVFKREILKELKFVEGRLCEDGLFTADLLINVNKGLVFSNEIYNYYDNPKSIVKTVSAEKKKKMIKDMLLAAQSFNSIIKKIDGDNFRKAFFRLRERQESYVFYAFVRMMKIKASFTEFKSAMSLINSGEYKCYPIRVFDGYGSQKNRLLLYIFNHKILLKFAIFMNKKLNFIR